LFIKWLKSFSSEDCLSEHTLWRKR